MKKQNILTYLLLAALVVMSAVSVLSFGDRNTDASIIVGNDYKSVQATSSGAMVVKNITGSFGSVIIASSSAQPFSVYDASTTAATTSANQIVRFPANAAVGTYVFDREIQKGIVIDAGPAFAGSYVVTWR